MAENDQNRSQAITEEISCIPPALSSTNEGVIPKALPVMKAEGSNEEYYVKPGDKRGHALFILPSKTHGEAPNEAIGTFENLGYQVHQETNENLNSEAMIKSFEKFWKDKVKEEDDSVVFVIIADDIFEEETYRKLVKILNYAKLRKKPKLIFIENRKENTSSSFQKDSSKKQKAIDEDADILVAYSDSSEKDFIKTLARVLKDHDKRNPIPDIQQLVIEVNGEISKSFNEKKLPFAISKSVNEKGLISTLRKLFYFYDFMTRSKKQQTNSTSPGACAKFEPLRYDINRGKTSGGALIINNMNGYNGFITRNGSQMDCDKIEETLKKLGYKTYVNTNVNTIENLMGVFDVFKNEDIHKEADSAVVVILSHGKLNKICTCDNNLVQLKDLWNKLKFSECEMLKDKPKIFFIQSCRGREEMSENETDGDQSVRPETTKSDILFQEAYNRALEYKLQEPLQKISYYETDDYRQECTGEDHFFTAYACSPGWPSLRNPEEGSLFIQNLCKSLNDYADKDDNIAKKHDINTLLTSVIEVVGRKTGKVKDYTTGQMSDVTQIPKTCSSLTKLFYFQNQAKPEENEANQSNAISKQWEEDLNPYDSNACENRRRELKELHATARLTNLNLREQAEKKHEKGILVLTTDNKDQFGFSEQIFCGVYDIESGDKFNIPNLPFMYNETIVDFDGLLCCFGNYKVNTGAIWNSIKVLAVERKKWISCPIMTKQVMMSNFRLMSVVYMKPNIFAAVKTDYSMCKVLMMNEDFAWNEIDEMGHKDCELRLVVVNEKLYCLHGGHDCRTVKEYNPETKVWLKKAEYDGFLFDIGFEAVALHDRIVIVAAGDKFCGLCDTYDTVKNKWEHLPNIPHPVANTSVATDGKRIFVLGCVRKPDDRNKMTVDTLQIYDYEENSWSGKKEINCTRIRSAIFLNSYGCFK